MFQVHVWNKIDTFIGYWVVKRSSAAFDPCNPGSYKVLDTYDRLVANSDLSSLRCDQYDLTLPDWYRFTGNGGDKMPTKCPNILRCGTVAPGWLNGAHPLVSDDVVTREVCYHWSENCCLWKNDIKVKNCGHFYVYELQRPPTCWLRYCGEYDKMLDCQKVTNTVKRLSVRA